MSKHRVIGVAGFKNAGKTTLVERLVSELTDRGFRVSTVKHAHHSFDIDHEGRDSFRHQQGRGVAGGGCVWLALGRGQRVAW
jgi:molybdopterin-guanine dinucleotide biosynthesis protein MobB